MDRWGIWLVGLAGRMNEGEFEPGWLKSYDPDGHAGRGDVKITLDEEAAMRFESVTDAAALWKTTSKVRPVREDGKPNRPLTAFHIEVRKL